MGMAPPPRSMEERVTALQKELERRDNEMAAMMIQMQALMGQLTTIASGVGTSQTPASSARQDGKKKERIGLLKHWGFADAPKVLNLLTNDKSRGNRIKKGGILAWYIQEQVEYFLPLSAGINVHPATRPRSQSPMQFKFLVIRSQQHSNKELPYLP